MKYSLLAMACGLMAIAACANIDRPEHANWVDSTFVNDRSLSEDSTDIELSDYCFMEVSGQQRKDTTLIHITLFRDKVTGSMAHLPFEKDKKEGPLEGKKRGDTLYLDWHYMQEGIADTIGTVFLIQNSRLRQKPFSYHEQTGKAYTDRAAKFSLSYKAVPCNF